MALPVTCSQTSQSGQRPQTRRGMKPSELKTRPKESRREIMNDKFILHRCFDNGATIQGADNLGETYGFEQV